jgi:putative inorganic carbon (HCO3(-)) transporter
MSNAIYNTPSAAQVTPLIRRLGALTLLLALAALLAFLPLSQAVLLATGAAAAVLLLRWPWLIWLPIAVLLPIASGFHITGVSLADLLLAGAVALWFFDGARRNTLPLQGSPVIVAVACYVVVLFLSAMTATDLGEASREVIKWLELWVLLLVAPAMVGLARARWVAAALVCGAVIQAIFGLYQFVYGIGPEYFVILGRFMRAYGSFGQPNPFGGYLGLTLPVALSLAIWAGQESVRRKPWRWSAILWALFYTGSTVIIAGGLLASWSRGAWLGAVAGVLVVLVLRSRTAAVLSGLVALVCLVAILLGAFSPQVIPAPIAARVQDIPAYFGLTDVLSEPLTDENFSVVERVAHWVAAQRMWERSPWLGVGPGNYAVIYPVVHLPKWDDALGHAHNVYLNVLGETGLAGLAAYLLLMLTAFVWTWRHLRQASAHPTPGNRWFAALAVGVLGVLVHLSVHNLVDNLFVQGMVLHAGLLLALVHVSID